METRITKLLGIQYPIIQGGMQWVGTAELASAVSNAGGLGVITALTQPTPGQLFNEIKRCQKMTSKPFGVNLTFLPAMSPPPYAEYVQAIVDSGVKIVETAGNTPKAFMPAFKAAGIIVIHKCTSLRHCISAEKVGVDALSVDGFECAGHPGEDDVPLFVLLPRVASVCKIPIIASGGIADGRGLLAAMALGADGINMGTRFLCTKEAPIHQNIKQKIVDSDELSTTHIFRKLHNTARVYKNSIAKEVVEIEKRPNVQFSDVSHLVSGQKGKQVYEKGDPEIGIWTAGCVMGLINDIPSCEELVKRIVNEAKEISQRRLTPAFAKL